MKWKVIVRDYLSFTRKERIGIIAVLLIITLAIFFPILFSQNNGKGQQMTDTTWIASVKKLEQKQALPVKNEPDGNEMNLQAYQYDQSKDNYLANELFYFDPNTLSIKNWQKLGVRDKTIQTIQNYLTKGGRFKKPGDLQKIYGFHKNEYERLAPYVKIENGSPGIQRTDFQGDKIPVENKPVPRKAFQDNVFDINTADTTAFISLPGIGSKLASRIINFRDKLGGFYSIEQVGETFGLPDSTFQKIRQNLKLENILIKKININTASADELKTHPYIKYAIANSIASYRNEHGHFSTIEDLKKIMIITEDVYRKISPYLATQ